MMGSINFVKSLFALTVCSFQGLEDSNVLKDYVDLMEHNHLYDDLGRHSYDQVIFYDWSPDYRRFHAITYYLVEEDITRVPQAYGDGYLVRWYDGTIGMLSPGVK